MWKAKFNKLYMVAARGSASAEVRVAEREGKARPAVVQFAVCKTEGPENEPVGALVLDEEIWKKWFGGKKLLPDMETAHSAAHWMVNNMPEVYYGCPLCAYKTKDEAEHTAHATDHTNRLLQFLDIEFTEETDDTT